MSNQETKRVSMEKVKPEIDCGCFPIKGVVGEKVEVQADIFADSHDSIKVNLDPYHTQSGWVQVPIDKFGISPDQSYLVHDLISEVKYIWYGEKNYVELNPGTLPIIPGLKKETDFDYFNEEGN